MADSGRTTSNGSPSARSIADKLSAIRHVALDLDGTVYKGRKIFPFTLEFLSLLDSMKIGYSFVTNNSSRNTADYLHHLREMGIEATAGQIVISTHATIRHLRKHFPAARKLCILGTKSMVAEFSGAGFECLPMGAEEEPDAVIIGFDPGMTYRDICQAAWWIKAGKLYVATHPDRVCPTDERTVLVDCGALCAALAEATGRAPDVVLGKPDPSMLDTVLESHALQPHQLAMVGDRLYTDVAMAQRIQAVAVLVLSGETTLAEARAVNPAPDIIVDDLAGFGALLRKARG